MKSLANQSANWVVDPLVYAPGHTFGPPLLLVEAVPGSPTTVEAFWAPLS